MPSINQAQLSTNAICEIAVKIFGDVVFTSHGLFLKEPIRKFIDNLLVHAWQRYRKSQRRDGSKRDKLTIEEQALWESTSNVYGTADTL
jgi:hypothetical protein